MKVNNPLWVHGKILLKYTGNNLLLLDSTIKVNKVVLFNEIINDYNEPLLLKINLFNNNEILLSLKSFVIYIEKDVWEIQESSLNNITTIIVDNEYIVVKGNFSFCNEINEINRYLDTYEYDIIFKNIDVLISKLEEENIEFIDFRNG